MPNIVDKGQSQTRAVSTKSERFCQFLDYIGFHVDDSAAGELVGVSRVSFRAYRLENTLPRQFAKLEEMVEKLLNFTNRTENPSAVALWILGGEHTDNPFEDAGSQVLKTLEAIIKSLQILTRDTPTPFDDLPHLAQLKVVNSVSQLPCFMKPTMKSEELLQDREYKEKAFEYYEKAVRNC